jgi:hypothetical protein
MKRRFFAGVAAVAAVTASILTASGAVAATPDVATVGAPGGATPNSQLPAAIQVDEAKFKVVASFVGIGKQVYSCKDNAFAFQEPVAGLLSRGVQAAIHGKGPFWASFDGSHVDGSPTVPPSSAQPDPKSIPWLKLIGTSTPNTTGVFSNIAFVQRLDTRGGVAPTGTCTAPKTVAVDYTANYVFWGPR